MDGVISDFDRQFVSMFKISPNKYKSINGKEKFWKIITSKGIKYWSDMPAMKNYQKLISILNTTNIPIEILSAPSKDPASKQGKIEWLKKHGITYKQNFVPAIEKQNYATPNSLLIDDNEDNINQFISKGGFGILYKNYNQFINDLKPYLL